MALGYPGETNTLYRGEKLATAQDRHLVRPNVDTLYSAIFYDLAKRDLEFIIPEINDRYWCFPFYDLYGNNFANIGSLQGWKAGKYLLRYFSDDFGIESSDIPEGYQAVVNSPTPYGLALIRILVNNTESDVARVVEYQGKIQLNPVKSSIHTDIPSLDLNLFSFIRNENISQAEAVLQLLAKLAPYNLSPVVSDRPWVADMLRQAGISNGQFKQPQGTDLAAAVIVADDSSLNLRRLAGMTDHLGNDWSKTADHILGYYGSFYNARHIVAQRGYLALTRDQSFYPVYTAGNPSIAYEYSIGPDEAYVVTFSSKPKLKRTGFWSITVYDGNGYLIPNDLERYVLGDRSTIAYSDGGRVYGENEISDDARDDLFQILLQPADLRPPENWISNWLPAPAGGGKLSFSMRFYGAEEGMSNGEWVYPVIEKRQAMR